MLFPLDSPLNLFQIDVQLKKIIDLYTENGFLEFKIEGLGTEKMFVYSSDFKSATLDLKLQEGPQMKVGNIIFRGVALNLLPNQNGLIFLAGRFVFGQGVSHHCCSRQCLNSNKDRLCWDSF